MVSAVNYGIEPGAGKRMVLFFFYVILLLLYVQAFWDLEQICLWSL